MIANATVVVVAYLPAIYAPFVRARDAPRRVFRSSDFRSLVARVRARTVPRRVGATERDRAATRDVSPLRSRRDLARLEALDLFRSLAKETGAKLGYSYPMQLEGTVMTWVRDQAPECEGGIRER